MRLVSDDMVIDDMFAPVVNNDSYESPLSPAATFTTIESPPALLGKPAQIMAMDEHGNLIPIDSGAIKNMDPVKVVSDAIKSILPMANAPGSQPGDMTTIYLATGIAVVGILFLIFKN